MGTGNYVYINLEGHVTHFCVTANIQVWPVYLLNKLDRNMFIDMSLHPTVLGSKDKCDCHLSLHKVKARVNNTSTLSTRVRTIVV